MTTKDYFILGAFVIKGIAGLILLVVCIVSLVCK